MWPLTHSLLHRNHSHMEQSFRGHLDVPEVGDGLNLGVPGLCEECKKKKCVCKHDGGVDSLARRPQKPAAFALRPLVHRSGHREQADYGRQGTELSTGERHRCVMGAWVREGSGRWIGVREDSGASRRVRPRTEARLLC